MLKTKMFFLVSLFAFGCKPTRPTEEECGKIADNAVNLTAPPAGIRFKIYEKLKKECQDEFRESMWKHWRCIGNAKSLSDVDVCKKQRPAVPI